MAVLIEVDEGSMKKAAGCMVFSLFLINVLTAPMQASYIISDHVTAGCKKDPGG